MLRRCRDHNNHRKASSEIESKSMVSPATLSLLVIAKANILNNKCVTLLTLVSHFSSLVSSFKT